NWKQADAPWSFKFQRWILERQNRKVTINGNWPGQPEHCLTFDNPCLTESEIAAGKLARADASKFNDPIDFCFVGRLEDAKGVDIIIDAFLNLEPESGATVGTMHFVGDGVKRPEYEDRTKDSGIKFKFHGWLPREGVHDIFKRSSAILLPSASEGFPKVIPEAKNYGCVPIISKIKSLIPIISDGENGFILKDRTADQLIHVLNSFLSMTEGAKAKMVEFTDEDIVRYTYKFYNNRIMDEIIGD
ncbi:MAG: glycosyltransferase family 4 protein, partial [Flavobacteriaceae bacterium]|nr:glycosyltransferase family 4 protein [Flavobacteriaceae bacterium]